MADLTDPALPGLICTFYSYKGGVGRSMSLANVGVLIATEGHSVLLVDWDLEAPGLDVYFEKAARLVGDPSEMCGVLDLLEKHAAGDPIRWQNCLLKAEFFGHSLDIISSGRRTEDYRRRVQGLDWERLFREHRIGNYVNSLRDQWRQNYDFILVDSRTGITDIGDICTVILPDVLVFLFITNYQSVDGTKDVMARTVEARSKMPVNRSKLLAVPMPARDERDREYDKSLEWQQIFATEFSDLYREWLPKDVSPLDALNRLFIPYVASWSFGEHIPVIESRRERADPTSLGAAYARLATLLAHRLDWSAIEASASESDVVGARAELSKVREDAREAEIRRREEKTRREEEAREAKEKLQSAQAKIRRIRLIAVVGGLLTLLSAMTATFVYQSVRSSQSEGAYEVLEVAPNNVLTPELEELKKGGEQPLASTFGIESATITIPAFRRGDVIWLEATYTCTKLGRESVVGVAIKHKNTSLVEDQVLGPSNRTCSVRVKLRIARNQLVDFSVKTWNSQATAERLEFKAYYGDSSQTK